jgi:exodeoxyribonuclease V alpha subunit
VRLTTIFRQAAESSIVMGAHAINSGSMPELASPRELDKDFVFVTADDADELATKIVGVVSVSLPKRGIPACDVQVLTPMQRGSAGAAHLNQRLQEALNPKDANKPEAHRGGKTLRLGDRVIQVRNNYDKNIFNGDVGAVIAVDSEEEQVTVRFADLEIKYDYSELDELMLAYALSIHKSQGSEFPAVVIALHPQHYALLQRQLIYTALTRARSFAVLVGSKRAVAMAVRNNRPSQRLTLLKERLQGLI